LFASIWGLLASGLALIDFGIRVALGRSKEAEIAAIEAVLGGGFEESEDTGFGTCFLTTGGGVDRFRAFGFSKLAANALKAGDLPLTLIRSGLNDMLLERWDLSGTLDLPVCVDVVDLLFGLSALGFTPSFTKDNLLSNELPCIIDFAESQLKNLVKYWGSLPSLMT
jgi:hypothetical protein